MYKVHLVGADIDAGETVGNDALDEAIECDVVREIPVAPGCVDL